MNSYARGCTSGFLKAGCCCMQVIIFDPQYDAYIPLCIANGGVPKAVKLNTEEWSVPHAGRRLNTTSLLSYPPFCSDANCFLGVVSWYSGMTS
jgi:hypothetical protein